MVFARAYAASKSTLIKSAWRVAALFVLTVASALLVPGLVDTGRLLLALSVPIGAACTFFARVLAIPAQLHKQTLTREEFRKLSARLERHYDLGKDLFLEGARLTSGELFEYDDWRDRYRGWFQATEMIVKEFDEGEAFMFRTLETKTQERPGLHQLKEKLDKLRLITARAYERARAPREAATHLDSPA